MINQTVYKNTNGGINMAKRYYGKTHRTVRTNSDGTVTTTTRQRKGRTTYVNSSKSLTPAMQNKLDEIKEMVREALTKEKARLLKVKLSEMTPQQYEKEMRSHEQGNATGNIVLGTFLIAVTIASLFTGIMLLIAIVGLITVCVVPKYIKAIKTKKGKLQAPLHEVEAHYIKVKSVPKHREVKLHTDIAIKDMDIENKYKKALLMGNK